MGAAFANRTCQGTAKVTHGFAIFDHGRINEARAGFVGTVDTVRGVHFLLPLKESLGGGLGHLMLDHGKGYRLFAAAWREEGLVLHRAVE